MLNTLTVYTTAYCILAQHNTYIILYRFAVCNSNITTVVQQESNIRVFGFHCEQI